MTAALSAPLQTAPAQPATESLVATLKGTEYDTGLDLEKMAVAAKHFRGVAQKLKDEGFLDPKVLNVDTNTLIYQVPGGMLSNLISASLSRLNAEDKYYDVLAEVPRVRKDFGYPPLVTPTSQIVGSQAVLNVLAGGSVTRWSLRNPRACCAANTAQLPGPVNEEVRKKAIGDAEDHNLPPGGSASSRELEKYREEIKGRVCVRKRTC